MEEKNAARRRDETKYNYKIIQKMVQINYYEIVSVDSSVRVSER